MKHVILLLLASFLLLGSAMPQDKLKIYRKRRQLSKTTKAPEPYGKVKKAQSKKSLFVIQKHDASHLHYDLRLEIDGVLASWAIPKGLPEASDERRLAMPTDDHPMEYTDFEGIIPEGHYGGGTVMVWDIGTYENIKKKNGKSISMDEARKQGSIEVFLKGKKIWGPYAIIKTNLGDKPSWIVLKMKKKIVVSQKRPIKKVRKDVSALTGRTLKQIATDRDAQWL